MLRWLHRCLSRLATLLAHLGLLLRALLRHVAQLAWPSEWQLAPPRARNVRYELVVTCEPLDVTLRQAPVVTALVCTPTEPSYEGVDRIFSASICEPQRRDLRPRRPSCTSIALDLPAPIRQRLILRPFRQPGVHPFLRPGPPDFSQPTFTQILLRIAPPTVHNKVYTRFHRTSLRDAAEHARREASRPRAPDNDPLTSLFLILLPKKNWDVRVAGLDALLAAYPPGKRPFPFQLEGIKFLIDRPHALLADEMGLGKTIQVILAVRAGIHAGRFQRVLVICPKSLLPTWWHEFATWAPELSVAIVHGPNKHLVVRRPHHIYITNYHTIPWLLNEYDTGAGTMLSKSFDLLVIDEIQNLKNLGGKLSQAAMRIPAPWRWALTGTPLENHFGEYRAVWRVINPHIDPYLSDATLLAVTKHDVLRREKVSVAKDLPARIFMEQFIELDLPQRRQYDALEREFRRDVRAHIRASSVRQDHRLRMHIFGLLTKLKQLCVYDPNSRTSAKMDWIKEHLDELHPAGKDLRKCEKALVFTQYSNLVWDEWRLQRWVERYHPLRYDSTLSDTERFAFLKKFQEDEKHRLAILGLRVGGTGLSLTRANHVIFLDQWWNPAVMQQAADRIHRFGQDRTCYITALVARDTIDERIVAILKRKQKLFDEIMDEIKRGRRRPEDLDRLERILTVDDMLEALGLKKE